MFQEALTASCQMRVFDVQCSLLLLLLPRLDTGCFRDGSRF